jgi:ribosome biogenesis GTPase A
LNARYKLTELPETPTGMLESIGRRLGCLMSGGEIDVHRAAEAFLRELRAGKIGRISLEEPAQAADIAVIDEDTCVEGSQVPLSLELVTE